ncbi:O-antigen ligase family protein [Flavobacterium sharifuzzamanii]|uniref:O-antigen ligase family protein n=1 Tax=Flavobacterium sharifuzzamanii TaxID=2211133 RepID=UPI000DAD85DE|nr:O-antigen ligase family protein [Flavobacterium sharifuzzamanii]KAF2082531.1 O-antigen ligase family protein [Flavobacterium sharifuzzamanii]
MSHTLDCLKKVFSKIDELWKNKTLLAYLLAAMLITLPFKHNIGSLTCIIFLLFSFLKAKKVDFLSSKALLLPILLYVLMFVSLIWTIETKLTIKGLQKEILLLLIPLAFCSFPKINRDDINKVIKWFSFAMVGFAMFYFLKAIIKFINSGDKGVFFYHELVTLELNAIYMAVFASLALFYFLTKKEKSIIDKAGFLILIVFIFLLSSKNIIVVDLVLIITYYSFFSTISRKTKLIILSAVIVLSISSILFIKPIRERFMIEFETMLVDSSLNKSTKEDQGPIYNISLKQAWNQDQFQQNDFFPGTAFRLFQIRIFKEMLEEENIFFTGFGLDASQNKIKEKVKEHNLYPNYGEFNFHNEYVQIFSELGIFGFLIVLSMLFVTIRSGIINKDFIHIAFAVTMIVLFLTESFLSRQRGIIFFIIFYCMFNLVNDCNEQKILK